MPNPYLIKRLSASPVALVLLHVVLGKRVDFADLRFGELAHHPARRAHDQRTIWNFLALGDERIRANEAILSDFRAVQDHALDADQSAIADGTAMQHDHVAHADVASYGQGKARIDVQHATILYLGICTYRNRVLVAAHHASEPDTGVRFQPHRADHHCVWRDPIIALAGYPAVLEREFHLTGGPANAMAFYPAAGSIRRLSRPGKG